MAIRAGGGGRCRLQDLDGSGDLQQAGTTLQPIVLVAIRVMLKGPFGRRVMPHGSSVPRNPKVASQFMLPTPMQRWEGLPEADRLPGIGSAAALVGERLAGYGVEPVVERS